MSGSGRKTRFILSALIGAAAAVGLFAMATTPALARATSTFIPLNSIRGHDCTGEQVTLSGRVHLVAHEQHDGSVIGHLNYQGVVGVGDITGDTYRTSSVDHFRLAAPFPSDITSVGTLHLIGPGRGNNLLVHVLEHVTVNANGEVTVSIVELSSECR